MPAEISYADEPQLAAAEFIDLLRRSTLAERRPVDDPVLHRPPCSDEADIILCARLATPGSLVGVARAGHRFLPIAATSPTWP
jgi:hypothetical protein